MLLQGIHFLCVHVPALRNRYIWVGITNSLCDQPSRSRSAKSSFLLTLVGNLLQPLCLRRGEAQIDFDKDGMNPQAKLKDSQHTFSRREGAMQIHTQVEAPNPIPKDADICIGSTPAASAFTGTYA
jgi:hypothetical protein